MKLAVKAIDRYSKGYSSCDRISMSNSLGLLLFDDLVGLLVGNAPVNSHKSIRSSAEMRAHFSNFRSLREIGSIDYRQRMGGGIDK